MSDNTLTPIEYINDGWRKCDDVIVWRGDSIIDNVFIDDGHYYVAYGNDYSDGYARSNKARVDKYSHCLRVEPSDIAYLRQQLRDIIEKIDDGLVLETLEELRRCVVWEVDDDKQKETEAQK